MGARIAIEKQQWPPVCQELDWVFDAMRDEMSEHLLLSVYKPRGMTRYGQCKLHAQRALSQFCCAVRCAASCQSSLWQ